jgi:NAD(P)-dependent dehydrogenase (short-subunit alcohol dehydrogenase family)
MATPSSTRRFVLVTGGTRGIGRAIADAFLAAGDDVTVCGRNPVQGLAAHFEQADLRDAAQAERLVGAVVARGGRIDILVNNAGGSPPVDAATASPRLSEKIVQLNLLAPLYCAQAANAVMQKHDGGQIINIASVSAVRPSPRTAVYGAAKAGLVSLTRSLAMEWAPKVRVNAIISGLVKTEAADDHYGGPMGIAAIEKTIPLGRMAVPADIANACVMLCSPLAAYVTGAALEVHGGGEPPVFLSAMKT